MDSLTWEERKKFDALLAETRHLIQFRDDGYTIGHPIRERLNGTLFGCSNARWDNGDIGLRGVFYLNDDGTIGEFVDVL